ncbi:MAG: acetate kinase [Armatimonadota bacterium]|nr:acetate kinase [Armatimonadota bacterium]
MNILALNAGSSSLKFRLFCITADAETVLTDGTVERMEATALPAAAQTAIEQCQPFGIEAVGHRVVQGGACFFEPTRITPDVLTDLCALRELDPLHNPTEVSLIEAAQKLLPDVPAVAVFDTAFHRTLPEVAWRYALPSDLSDRLGLRRYGFHGISHRYVSERLLHCLGRAASGTRLITCHLGSGASVCAIQDGQSVDTSMGMTPLEGLVMGTRSGDVDPGLLLYLLRTQNMTAEALDALLNQQSGLKGLAGKSDVRDLEQAAGAGDAHADLALEIFAYRVRKYLGAYAAALGGLDAVAFTGGIGEHSAAMRERICRGLEFLGLRLDAGHNQDAQSEACISLDGSPVQVWVIPTDEERQIAREVAALVLSAG